MGSQRSWQGPNFHCYRRSRCLLIFVLLALPLSATTYYVDNCVVTGNDSNNGTSTSTPWLTVNKVNTSSFNPGDSVLFEKTCTWREQLQPPSAGSAGNPITIGSYGIGTNPIISGFNVMTGFTVVSGSVYSLSGVTTAPSVVAYNGSTLFYNHVGSSITANQWDWASNVLYINVGNPSGGTVEVGQRNFAVDVLNTGYVTVNNLSMTGANRTAIYLDTSAGYEIVQNNTVFNSLQGIGTSTNAGSNNLIQNNTVHDTVEYGINLYTAAATNDTIQNNEIYNLGGKGGTSTNMQGIYARTGAGLLIQSNYIHDGGDSQCADHGIYLDTTNGASGPIIIRYNKIANWKADGIKVSNSQYVNAYSNVIYGFGYAGMVVEVGSPSYVNLYNNVIANSNATNNSFGLWVTAGNYITFKNNIIYNVKYTSPSLSLYNYYIQNSPTNLAIDYNLVYDPTSNASGYYANYNGNTETWATWQAAGFDTHGVNADPKFTNAGSADFSLQSSSPAIDAGTNLGTSYEYILDPRTSFPWGMLNQNSQGLGWEIGAFVFVQQIPPAPPTGLSATVK